MLQIKSIHVFLFLNGPLAHTGSIFCAVIFFVSFRLLFLLQGVNW